MTTAPPNYHYFDETTEWDCTICRALDPPTSRRVQGRYAVPPSGSTSWLTQAQEHIAKKHGWMSNFIVDEAARERGQKRKVKRSVAAEVGESDEQEKAISGEELVLNNEGGYEHHFHGLKDPSGKKKVAPGIELEYPGLNATERIVLMKPIVGSTAYDPVKDVVTTIEVVLNHYLTPPQSLSYFSHQQPSSPSPCKAPQTPSFLTLLRQTVHDQDGKKLVDLVKQYNAVIRALKEDGTLKANIENMEGLDEEVWMKICSQAYERVVEPGKAELFRQDAPSDNLYGEALPLFTSVMCHEANLDPDSAFVDLGSGVGNCIIQVALATGASTHGYEIMPNSSALALAHVAEAQKRFKMWGVKGGSMRVVEADFLDPKIAEVGEVLGKAGVVLANNEVWSSWLNTSVSALFPPQLQAGTKIISMKPLAPRHDGETHHDALLRAREMGRDVEEREYESGSMSWKAGKGVYCVEVWHGAGREGVSGTEV